MSRDSSKVNLSDIRRSSMGVLQRRIHGVSAGINDFQIRYRHFCLGFYKNRDRNGEERNKEEKREELGGGRIYTQKRQAAVND